MKEACLAKWDTNGDRVFSVEEAAAVESLIDYEDANDKFAELLLDPDFTSFDEFQYFTSVTSVTPEAQFAVFYNCKHLTSIILPNSITSIGINAFKDCPLTSIHIPSSVTEIQM